MKDSTYEKFEYKGNWFKVEIMTHYYNSVKYAKIIDLKLDNPKGILEFPKMTKSGIEIEGISIYENEKNLKKELEKCRELVIDDDFMHGHTYGFETLKNQYFPAIEKVIVPVDSQYYATNEEMTMLLSKDKKKLVQILAEGCKDVAVIPQYVKYIYDYAFDGSKCKEIDFPKGVKFQSNQVLSNCEYARMKDSSLNISKGTLIGIDKEMKFLDLPEEVTCLENNVFKCRNTIQKIRTHVPLTKTMLAQITNLREYELTRPVGKIEQNLFSDNKVLEKLTVSEQDPKYKTIDGVLFSKDGKRLIYYPMGKQDSHYTIPDGTRVIMPDAFANNRYIENVIMPDTVESIGVGAFCGSSLKQVRLSAGLKEIPDWNMYNSGGTFMECELTNVTIPKNLRYIGRCAFLNCRLKTVIFEDESKLETIGPYAFAENKIDKISLPKSVKRVAMGSLRVIEHIETFEGCAKGLISAVSSVPYYENNKVGNMEWFGFEITCHMKNNKISRIIIPSSIKRAYAYMYDNAWNGSKFDFDVYDEAFEAVALAEEKLAITTERIMKSSDNKMYEDFMRSSSMKIATELLNKRKEREFLEFLDKGYLSDASIKKLLHMANEKEMTTVTAYIMDKINEVNGEKKRKGTRFAL